MKMHPRIVITSFAASALMAAGFGVWQGRAQVAEKDPAAQIDDQAVAGEINTLNDQVKEKQSAIDDLGDKIKSYQALIAKKENEAVSLADQLALLENRTEETKLAIEQNQAEMDAVDAQIVILDKQINALDAQLLREKQLLADILREINSADGNVMLQALFSSKSFAELFDQLQYLQTVNDDLSQALDRAKSTNDAVIASRTEQLGKRTRLADLETALESHRRLLDQQKNAQESLLVASKNSEAQYRSFLADSRQEEADVEQQIARLQGLIENKLKNSDDTVGNSSLMSWPVDPSYRGLSTLFHDPTYPFKNLFAHSGIDIPQKQGTPVGAAAPGYVAWTRVGNQYGNYVMIIHANGTATLYAHLSKILVKQDQFVTRGQVIALSGGTPGIPGSGFSTGAHLHFEVRKSGIPVDPLPYMISKP